MKDELNEIVSSILNFEDPDNLYKLYRLTTQPIVPFRITGIDSKLFHYWKSNELSSLSEGKPRERIRYRLQDIIWLYMVEEMRYFGLSFDIIQAVKKEMLGYLDVEIIGSEYIKVSRRNNILEIAKKKKITDLLEKLTRELTTEEKAIFLEEFTPEKIEQTLKINGLEITLLQALILSSILKRQETGVFIYKDGRILPFVEELIDNKKNPWGKILFASHVYISITKHFLDFLYKGRRLSVISNDDKAKGINHLKREDYEKLDKKTEDEKTDFISRFGILEPHEHEIIKMLKDHDIKKIEISKAKDGSKNLIVKVSVPKKFRPGDTQNIAKYLKLVKHTSVEVVYGSDNLIHVTIMRTEKL